ncbi:DGQHR domain-containing protein [Pseudomonas trivialis]|uniref:DGQHR domain-containing protein n=1 Tax=Pseudomonas trivialis TaxID=200450 RepID=UPI0030D11BA5
MNYNCLTFSQRNDGNAPTFCLFEAPVKDVVLWSTIPTLTPDNTDGIQRPLKDSKVRAIKKFLESDTRNTIPTAIVLTISSNACRIDGGNIVINVAEKENILVIDGQHRLCGLNAFDENSRVPIVAILDATSEERAFQFIIINNKVTKVAPDHIRALTLRLTKEEDKIDLENRLKTSRLSLSPQLSYVGLANDLDESPFKGIIALPSMPEDDRKVVPSAIETSIAYIQSKNIQELSSEDAAYDFL